MIVPDAPLTRLDAFGGTVEISLIVVEREGFHKEDGVDVLEEGRKRLSYPSIPFMCQITSRNLVSRPVTNLSIVTKFCHTGIAIITTHVTWQLVANFHAKFIFA